VSLRAPWLRLAVFLVTAQCGSESEHVLGRSDHLLDAIRPRARGVAGFAAVPSPSDCIWVQRV
jgi:hypothetical protein